MNRLLLIFYGLMICSLGYSQVQEGARAMSQGSKNALTMTLGNADAKDAEDSWIKFVKDYKGKTKKNKKTGEIFSDDCMISALSANTIDIYAKITQKGADSELAVWYDLGGAYLGSTSHPTAYAESKAMLERFSLNVSTLALETEIATQESAMKKMQSELAGLKKDQAGYEAEITKCEKKIAEAKANIEENAVAQKAKEQELKVQEGKLKVVEEKLKGMN